MVQQSVTRIASALLGLTLAASAASAQSFTNITSTDGSGVGGFWNRPSSDNLSGQCNAGSVLTGSATAAGCDRENFTLPFTGSPATQFLGTNSGNTAAQFVLGGGSWQIRLIGNITGSTPIRPWEAVGLSTAASQTTTSVGSSFVISDAAGVRFGISAWAPVGVQYYSNSSWTDVNSVARNQFALFGLSSVDAPSVSGGVATISNNWAAGRKYYVAMEDNACLNYMTDCQNATGSFTTFSDYDYNDAFLEVTAIPEPSTVALMAAGMVGLFAAGYRRRKA